VTATRADGVRGVVSMTPFLAKGGVFTAQEFGASNAKPNSDPVATHSAR